MYDPMGYTSYPPAPVPPAVVWFVGSDPAWRRWAGHALREAGITLTTSFSLSHAVEETFDGLPDMVLMEVKSLEELKRLVGLTVMGETSVIGLGERDHVVGALEAGATDVLTRDMSSMEVVARLNAHYRTARTLKRVSHANTSLRDNTKRVRSERQQAKEEAESLRQYARFFDSAADGIAVLDPGGRVIFANPRAYHLVGREAGSVGGKKIKEIVHHDDRATAKDLWERVQRGEHPRDVDLRVMRGDGTSMVASVSFASVQQGEGSVLIHFRDVTESRAVETELLRTKEFLEALVQACPDGIVACDLSGKIILFNDSAARMLGILAAEALDRGDARTLYADGEASRMMNLLRAARAQGRGHISAVRTELRTAQGEPVPVELSAAFICEGRRPVATFGILKDLRDHIEVEERLEQAQMRLAQGEKQALIAELAGAAAHELNQPLTSLLACADLLVRKIPADAPGHDLARTMSEQVERMADIIRKVGKITKYETKSYVGGQRIVDLDRASADGDGPSPTVG